MAETQSQGQQERESQREGWGAQARSHLQLLGVADAVVQDVDLRRPEERVGRAGGRGAPSPSRAPSPSPSPAWPPANTGLTSYFCCFSFAIRSNFSDSSWWIQSDSSWAFSLAGQKGCWGREPGRAPGPEGLTEPFEFGFTGAIVLIIWGSFVNMQSRSQQGGL